MCSIGTPKIENSVLKPDHPVEIVVVVVAVKAKTAKKVTRGHHKGQLEKIKKSAAFYIQPSVPSEIRNLRSASCC